MFCYGSRHSLLFALIVFEGGGSGGGSGGDGVVNGGGDDGEECCILLFTVLAIELVKLICILPRFLFLLQLFLALFHPLRYQC